MSAAVRNSFPLNSASYPTRTKSLIRRAIPFNPRLRTRPIPVGMSLLDPTKTNTRSQATLVIVSLIQSAAASSFDCEIIAAVRCATTAASGAVSLTTPSGVTGKSARFHVCNATHGKIAASMFVVSNYAWPKP